jgi:hypothetical protein
LSKFIHICCLLRIGIIIKYRWRLFYFQNLFIFGGYWETGLYWNISRGRWIWLCIRRFDWGFFLVCTRNISKTVMETKLIHKFNFNLIHIIFCWRITDYINYLCDISSQNIALRRTETKKKKFIFFQQNRFSDNWSETKCTQAFRRKTKENSKDETKIK